MPPETTTGPPQLRLTPPPPPPLPRPSRPVPPKDPARRPHVEQRPVLPKWPAQGLQPPPAKPGWTGLPFLPGSTGVIMETGEAGPPGRIGVSGRGLPQGVDGQTGQSPVPSAEGYAGAPGKLWGHGWEGTGGQSGSAAAGALGADLSSEFPEDAWWPEPASPAGRDCSTQHLGNCQRPLGHKWRAPWEIVWSQR